MPHRCQRSVCRRSGFTLIELLIVLSLIGTLMALLLPAAMDAHRKGRMTKCMGNARQIVSLFNIAVQDLRMVYPSPAGNDNAFAQDATLKLFFKDINLLKCPSDSGAPSYPGGSPCFNAGLSLASYCYAKSDISGVGVAGLGGKRASAFRSPSQKALLVEPTLDPANGCSWHSKVSGSGMVGFLDSHALLAPTNCSPALGTTDMPPRDRLYY